jgi:hypothetical protein
VGELAPAIHATLDMYGEHVDVVVFHSGQEEDPEDRRLQSKYLSKLMGDSPRPLILLSYLVTKPLEGNYNTYVSEESGMKDIDPSDWDRWCEYILYKRLRRTGYARVSRGTITDTEIQVRFTQITSKKIHLPFVYLLTKASLSRSASSQSANPKGPASGFRRSRSLRVYASPPCLGVKGSAAIDTTSSMSRGTTTRTRHLH